MIRINIVVEGHSEEQFVRDIVGEYLAPKGIYVGARRVKTGRKSGKDYRGGVTTTRLHIFRVDKSSSIATICARYALHSSLARYALHSSPPYPLYVYERIF